MKHFLFFAALLIANAIGAKVTLPHIMGNDMVLQQQSLCRLWGKATPGKSLTVTTSWNNRKYKTIASENGDWLVEVNTPKAGGPYKITFDDGEKTILDNILIGEVWICSGQSNMEMPVQGFLGQPTNNSLETIAKAGNYPNIRFISLPQTDSTQPLSDCDATWKVSNSENIPTLSANAYFFAKMLNETLHVPVGIIVSCWGGSSIESWMSPEALQSVDGWDRKQAEARKKIQQRPSLLYNGMITPINKFSAKGFLWSQGEGNIQNYKLYAQLKTAMVKQWRTEWKNPNMPFYFAMSAPGKGHKGKPFLVEQQIKCLDMIPNSGIVLTTDLGKEFEYHYPQANIVGERFAILALSEAYQMKGFPAHGPLLEGVVIENGRAIVTYKDTPLGLCPTSYNITGFEMAGADRKFHPAKARIVDKEAKLVVECEEVPEPIAVRYAFHSWYETNLTNTFGLPAQPFRTDNWDNVE